jgi:glycosyltransferase involved in cell wall biosynthesis
MAPSPQIAVIVPAHRAEETIGACLDGLFAQTLPAERFEIHVVDTGKDATASVVRKRAADWEGRLFHHTAERPGPGSQRNLGVSRTTAPALAFTDADCVPTPEWLEAGAQHLRQGAEIVQGPTLTPNGSPPPPFSHAIFLRGPSPLYESCNIMYEAGAFRRAGGFSVDLFESMGSHMGEDTELAWRVLRAGGTVAYEPRAVVRHTIHPADFIGHLRYEWQARFFPRLVRRVPELRREMLATGLFLSRRSMRFSGALAAVALASRSRWAWALAIPYAAELALSARGAPTSCNAVGAVGKRLIADSVREAGLIWGSARYRSPVL